MPTPMPTRAEARKSLDVVIRKSRVHLYKPIQIAEILYHDRVYHDVDLNDLETYRNRSKKWRDDVSRPLLGRVCTSSARFQDNLFEENAIPPQVIAVLGEENRRTQGAVEAYIYRQFNTKHDQMAEALHVCQTATPENFDVKAFIDSFWQEPGLKRSLDKIYEIGVYALFSALVEEMQLQVTISVTKEKIGILTAFSAFARKVMCLEPTKLTHTEQAKVFRVGVTNAADRGLDMYSNWGPAIQIKHLSLDVELAQNIVQSISSDRIVIVCKEAEREIILSLLTQIGWKSRIQSIVTENELVAWYEKALRGGVSEALGETLLRKLRQEIALEFPSVGDLPALLRERHYEEIRDAYWV